MANRIGLVCLFLSLSAIGIRSQSVKEPFILKNGVKYRDMLTLMASQAAADYADTYSRRQEREIRVNKANNKEEVQSPKFYSLRLDTPTGVPAVSNALYFSTSRRISIDPKHVAERVIADKDEETIVAEEEGRAPPAENTDIRTRSSAPLISQLPSRRQRFPQNAQKRRRQNRYLYKTATQYGSPSSSYSIIRGPGINVGIDTNHETSPPPPRQGRRQSSRHNIPSYSYTIKTGAAFRHG